MTKGPWARGGTGARLAAFAALVSLCTASTGAAQTGLTGAPQLARVYDAILDARFDQVGPLLTQTCGPRESPGAVAPSTGGLAPAEACQLLELVSLWWQIQIDPRNPAHDDEFRMRADASIAAVEAWTRREPMRAEAWFYLGGAYGARAQWRVLREERLAAARDGKRIKRALEQALDLDPELQDAYFGIGLYHYYAAVAPMAARMLRWLLWLPGGDRAGGLKEMLRARGSGQLLHSEADYQLHLISLWYEKQPDRALQLLRGLRDRHPRNPHFLQLIAEVEDVYLHDVQTSLRSWQLLLEAAQSRRVAEPLMAEATARLGVARQLDRRSETEAAIPHLRAVIAMKPTAPYGVIARAHVQLGQALDHLGRRSEALTEYRAALASLPPGDPEKIEARARAGLRAPHTRSKT
ncbi:MAG TPA: tetratricopeptide repeat protein [Vicinamibacterales bacterium]|nr:tetratricopeptide repeat protein [Vicinamibacterales bacterium]